MPKVLVTPRSFGVGSTKPLDYLTSRGCQVVTNTTGRLMTSEELVAAVSDVDGVIAGIERFSREVIAAGSRLRVISRYGVGYDAVDLEAATERGVVVTNTPGTNSDSVADLAFGLLLAAARSIPLAARAGREASSARFIGRLVWGKTLGIVGLGRIGTGVARRARGFSMRVLYHKRTRVPDVERELGIEYAPLDDLLRESDYVSLHVPLTDQTRSMLGSQQLALMKPSAVLVNTARRGLVDLEALYEALTSGRLAAAAIDELDEGPLAEKIRQLDNVIVTPHIGAHTEEAIEAMGVLAAANLVDVLEGRRPPYVVNPEVYEARPARGA